MCDRIRSRRILEGCSEQKKERDVDVVEFQSRQSKPSKHVARRSMRAMRAL
jgi:hypothetical protein